MAVLLKGLQRAGPDESTMNYVGRRFEGGAHDTPRTLRARWSP